MEDWGLKFEVMTADIDERAIRDSDPVKLTLKLAHVKADALLARIKEPALLLTSDHLISFQDKIYEKPDSIPEAKAMLKSYGGGLITGVTSVVVTNPDTRRKYEGTALMTLRLAPFSDMEIEKICKDTPVTERAGAITVNHPIFESHLVEFTGEMETLKGLPKALTLELLEKAEE